MTASPRRPGDTAVPINIGEEWPPFLILLCLTLLFLAQTPAVQPVAQLLCVFGGIVGLVATVAVCRGFAENIGRAFWKAPTLLLFLLVAYTTYRYFTTPPIYSLLATTDLLRVYGGALAYFACAYILGSSRQLGRLVIGIAVFAVFVAFADFGKFGSTGINNAAHVENTSVLGLHMTVGGFLAMLLPVVAAFAFLPDGDDRQRLVSQLVFLVIGFALILARSRSAWLAGVASLLVVGALFGALALRERWRRGTEPKRSRRGEHPVARLLNSPFLWVGLGLTVLIVGGGLSGILTQRSEAVRAVLTGNITGGAVTFQSRLNSWRAALLMIREKPRVGYGLGGYMVEQGKWTHIGDETIQVLNKGTGHQNRAHSFYLQWGVDSGLVGLFLHIAFVVAWFMAMLRGFAVAPSPERRAFAIGAMGAVAAGAVDAIASPMYQMHGTYALWLAWMGIGLGALRADPPRQGISLAFSKGENIAPSDDHPAIGSPSPILDWVGAALLGAGSAVLCLLLADRIIAEGAKKPPGAFRVVQVPYVSEIRPGTRIVFKALYTDENGVDRPTLPGTQWEVYAAEDVLKAPGAGFIRLDGVRASAYGTGNSQSHAGLLLVPPPGTKAPAITVFGVYRDDYGRVYRKAATVAVRADAPEIVPYRFPGER
ncbi:MAG: O-antigen ligase family protein [Akkermansiaceae bacterium]|nr:O-antigen ligase family protein [Armatimonadota bacterium]